MMIGAAKPIVERRFAMATRYRHGDNDDDDDEEA